MSNELTSLLSTIASVSASFVAILGGFVASKLITINGERAAVKSQLTEIHFEKMLRTEERDILSRQLDEEDAICYIHDQKSGLVLCLLFSFFNIILPLSLSISSFSNKVIPFIQASSILLLTIGLLMTFWYFAKMLVWK